MANEGSTKPTYEELGRPKDLQPAFDLWLAAQQFYASVNSGTQQQITESSSRLREMLAKTEDTFNSWELCNKYDGLESELARVRGLLQRLGNAWEMDPHGDAFLDIMGELGAFDDDSGAESADIGKLDAVDEVGDYSCAVCGFGMMEPCEHWKRMAGSAETGGEKASDKKEKV